MGFPKFISFTILILIAFLSQSISAQIVFKELPNYELKSSDSSFFDISSTRSIISLDGKWNVYPADSKGKNKVQISVPSIFQGSGELIFEKHFSLTKDDLNNHKLKLAFLGLNYTADISVNGVIIYRHSGGEFPFQFDLPRDILGTEKSNLLTVRLYYKLDSENTIPLKQRFLFPQNFGGILKDVYIKLLPTVSIFDLSLSSNYEPGSDKAKINLFTKIDNSKYVSYNDTLASQNQYVLKVKFLSPGGNSVISTSDYSFKLIPNKEKNITQNFELNSPALWSPSNPQSYMVYIELWDGNNLIDRAKRPLAIYSLKPGKDNLKLNGSEFQLNGVTYIPSFQENGNLATYDQMENDIKSIKELGFNCVRFAKSVPHPFYLEMCQKYGLIAFIEIPLNSVPGDLAQDQNFISRCKNYLSNFIWAYRNYSAVAAIGLGSSYFVKSEPQIALLKSLASIVKKNSEKLTYASFSGMDIPSINNIDLYGVELFDKSINDAAENLKNLQSELGASRVFISSATYVVNIGNTNGYVNDYSFEAQAKYFEDLIDYSANNPLSGYFINSMFDYRGDYASLVAGYNKNNVYQIGICGEDRSTNRIGYKVIYSKLHNSEKVTIPIGSKKDDAPMIFILSGLILAIIMGVLVNSGKKFREDSSRALLRPYNFFADVRDLRIMSGYHTTVLALIVSAVTALTFSNLLFYFRENIVFEKLLLSFGSSKIIKVFSYLSWHPTNALLWLTIIFFIILLLLSIVVKVASFFVRNRVFLSSAYFSVVWSFLPFVLLIPVGIVLYRILNADVVNLYIYLGLLFFVGWVFYRLMKGVYVIYDVNAGSVYFYSIIIILVLLCGFIFYYQMKNSVLDYLQLTFKQYKILG